MNVKKFLEERGVPFSVVEHPDAFDAQRLAHAVHTSGRHVAKTVLVRADHDYRFVLAVLPATHSIDLDRLSQALGNATVALADECDLAERFPDCTPGVLPPFGSHYAAETLVDQALADGDEIVFAANEPSEAIAMHFCDFYEAEHPRVVSFARPAQH